MYNVYDHNEISLKDIFCSLSPAFVTWSAKQEASYHHKVSHPHMMASSEVWCSNTKAKLIFSAQDASSEVAAVAKAVLNEFDVFQVIFDDADEVA